ncbi:MAG: zinc transporter [Actinobacteria bacterium]|nr:zinc transporter [Actinomycetota bacterium]
MQALLATIFTWGMTALGASLVFITRSVNRRLLDIMLEFAAGVMIFVVVEELIPEPQRGGHTDVATLGALGGFALMMILDVALG